MATNPNPNVVNCKVVLLGETTVGKTSIISRFINDSFDPNCITSLGASFISKTIYVPEHKKTVKFDIWDTAGQEKYRSLARIFYKDAVIIIFVYDITKKSTFDEIKKYWVGQIKDFGIQNPILALAANKSDLYDKEQVDEKEAKEYADSIGAVFKSTSALSNTGIDILFNHLGRKFLDPKYDYQEEDKKCAEEYQKEQERLNGGGKIKLENANKNNNAGEKNCNC